MPGTTLARGNIRESFIIGPSLTPSSVGANTTAAQTFTVRGLLTGDIIQITTNVAQTAGIGIANTRVTANDTLEITFSNSTGGGVIPVAGVYVLIVDRPENIPLPANAA